MAVTRLSQELSEAVRNGFGLVGVAGLADAPPDSFASTLPTTADLTIAGRWYSLRGPQKLVVMATTAQTIAVLCAVGGRGWFPRQREHLPIGKQFPGVDRWSDIVPDGQWSHGWNDGERLFARANLCDAVMGLPDEVILGYVGITTRPSEKSIEPICDDEPPELFAITGLVTPIVCQEVTGRDAKDVFAQHVQPV